MIIIMIHDNKRFNEIISLKFVICQFSNNTWKCEQWFMKNLVQKFKILVFMDHLSCLFNYIIGVCLCRNIFSYVKQIHDHLIIGITLQKLIWNLISCYNIDTTWITFFVFTLVFLFIIRCHFPKSKSLDYRYRKLDLDVQFLDTCIREDLCPTLLRYKMSNKRLKTSNVYRHSRRLFLQEQITFKFLKKKRPERCYQN